MTKRYSLVFALVIISTNIFAQSGYSELDANNIKARIFATGDLFRTSPGQSLGFEAPAGSGLSTIFRGNLWVGGLSPDQQLKLAAETDGFGGSDWFNGPLSTDGNAEVSDLTEFQYDFVWSANSADVEDHILYFDMVADGATEQEINNVFPGGYEIPSWIMEWPAHGNVSNGEAFYLAPFFDSNNNGQFDPNNGDYPVFCGDQCLFFIFNDKGGMHTISQAQSIGLEVHAMVYSFDQPNNEALHNSVFLKYKLINRGNQTLIDTYVGLWTDFDIGGPMDDYITTDVKRGALIAYNGDANDESVSGTQGYEDDLPAQALVILGGPTKEPDAIDNELPDNVYSAETNSYGDFGPWNADGIVDNERFGLSYSLAYNSTSNGVNGEPSQSPHYYNYLRAVWKNGQLMNNGETFDPMKYTYPGNSDPLNLGSEGVIVNEWSEESLQNEPGDRKGICSMGPFTLTAGAVHYIDAAYVFARESDDDIEANVRQTLDQRIVDTRLFFNDNLISCSEPQLNLNVSANNQDSDIQVYPNPASDLVNINVSTLDGSGQIQIFDALGKLVFYEKIVSKLNTIDTDNLENGIYTIKILTKKNTTSKKLVVRG